MQNFEIPPNNAQKIDSIMYEIDVYNLGLTPELNTLKLYYARRCHEREKISFPIKEKISPPKVVLRSQSDLLFYLLLS